VRPLVWSAKSSDQSIITSFKKSQSVLSRLVGSGTGMHAMHCVYGWLLVSTYTHTVVQRVKYSEL